MFEIVHNENNTQRQKITASPRGQAHFNVGVRKIRWNGNNNNLDWFFKINLKVTILKKGFAPPNKTGQLR